MLELIVLGQIPGTNVYLSFNDIVLSILAPTLAIVAGYGYIKIHDIRLQHKNTDQEVPTI